MTDQTEAYSLNFLVLKGKRLVVWCKVDIFGQISTREFCSKERGRAKDTCAI